MAAVSSPAPGGASSEPEKYTFEVSSVPFPGMHGEEVRKNFIKWDITRSQVARFRFDKLFLRSEAPAFVSDFFNDPNVQQCIMMCDRNGGSLHLSGKVRNIKFTSLKCTAVSLEFFDRLYSSGIVREEDQYIAKCLDRFLPDGVTVSDRLREMFLCGDDSENAELFSDDEKAEFLYHVLWRIVAGGGLCQWEDDLTAYRDTCKLIYKDLVGVQKNPCTDEIETCSLVYQVTDLEANIPLFGRDVPNHNFCYLSVNPVRREVCYWYSSFVSVW